MGVDWATPFLAACTVALTSSSSFFASLFLSTPHPHASHRLATGAAGTAGTAGAAGVAGTRLGWRLSGCGFTCGITPHVFFGFASGSSDRGSSTTGFSSAFTACAGACVAVCAALLRVRYASARRPALTSSSWISFSDRTGCGATFFHVIARFGAAGSAAVCATAFTG